MPSGSLPVPASIATPGRWHDPARLRVLAQGEDGECLYVIETGTMDVYKVIDGSDKKVKTCTSGDAFGELALLYNCPRAASVEAAEQTTLWELDRESFNNIVKDAASKKREKYENFLKGVKLLENMQPYERMTLADALRAMFSPRGSTLLTGSSHIDSAPRMRPARSQAETDSSHGSPPA